MIPILTTILYDITKPKSLQFKSFMTNHDQTNEMNSQQTRTVANKQSNRIYIYIYIYIYTNDRQSCLILVAASPIRMTDAIKSLIFCS